MIKPVWLQEPETQTLLAAFAGHGADIRFVGGCVRDALLGINAKDIDAATPLTPDKVTALLEAERIRVIPTGIDHGTVTALVDKRSFEITTLRRDTACDGRHAAVEYTTDWKEDASRRDFTINAFYLSPEGELFDYFGGQDDLKNGVVRFIGDAGDRVQEDYLRILRFFRFHAWYGKGGPDAAALAACKTYATKMVGLSGERIQVEMLKLLAAPNPIKVLQVMQQTGVLAQVLSSVTIEHVRGLTAVEDKPDPGLRLAALAFDADIKKLAEKWKLPGAFIRMLDRIISAARQVEPTMGEAAQKKLLRKMGVQLYTASVKLAAARSGAPAPYQPLLELPKRWTPPEFPIDGEDLKALGFSEGKALGDALHQLEVAWEAGDYAPTKNELLEKAKALR